MKLAADHSEGVVDGVLVDVYFWESLWRAARHPSSVAFIVDHYRRSCRNYWLLTIITPQHNTIQYSTISERYSYVKTYGMTARSIQHELHQRSFTLTKSVHYGQNHQLCKAKQGRVSIQHHKHEKHVAVLGKGVFAKFVQPYILPQISRMTLLQPAERCI